MGLHGFIVRSAPLLVVPRLTVYQLNRRTPSLSWASELAFVVASVFTALSSNVLGNPIHY